MKRGWIIMCILVFGIVGCKDFLNLVPKNKRDNVFNRRSFSFLWRICFPFSLV